MIVDIMAVLALTAIISLMVGASDTLTDEMICVGFCQRTTMETHNETNDPNDPSVEESEDE